MGEGGAYLRYGVRAQVGGKRCHPPCRGVLLLLHGWRAGAGGGSRRGVGGGERRWEHGELESRGGVRCKNKKRCVVLVESREKRARLDSGWGWVRRAEQLLVYGPARRPNRGDDAIAMVIPFHRGDVAGVLTFKPCYC